jgi:hypothetical protein
MEKPLAGQLYSDTTIVQSRSTPLLHQNTSVGQMMINDKKEPYRAAYAEASLELKEIFGKIEELHTRRARIEKVVEVLGRKIVSDQGELAQQVHLKTQRPGLTVMTRLTTLKTAPKAGK